MGSAPCSPTRKHRQWPTLTRLHWSSRTSCTTRLPTPARIPRSQRPGGPWQTGYDGEGVVVGVIDSGIGRSTPALPMTAAIRRRRALSRFGPPNCEFGNTAHNPDHVAFACNNKLIGARQMLATYRFLSARPDELIRRATTMATDPYRIDRSRQRWVEASVFGDLADVPVLHPSPCDRLQRPWQPGRIRIRPCGCDRPSGG